MSVKGYTLNTKGRMNGDEYSNLYTRKKEKILEQV